MSGFDASVFDQPLDAEIRAQQPLKYRDDRIGRIIYRVKCLFRSGV